MNLKKAVEIYETCLENKIPCEQCELDKNCVCDRLIEIQDILDEEREKTNED
jgi:hypothetical protein